MYQLGRMSHPVLGQMYMGRNEPVKGPESVMRVREIHSGCQLGLNRRSAEHQSLGWGKMRTTIQEAGAQNDIGFPTVNPRDHRFGVLNSVLTVSIEGHNALHLGILQGKLDPRLESCTLSKIYRMLDDDRTSRAGDVLATVPAAVVDANDVGKLNA